MYSVDGIDDPDAILDPPWKKKEWPIPHNCVGDDCWMKEGATDALPLSLFDSQLPSNFIIIGSAVDRVGGVACRHI